MKQVTTDRLIIAGLAIRTKNQEAAETIPALWGRFFSEEIPSKIPSPSSADVYAVYTDFEYPGVSNEGEYTFLIGLPVDSASLLPDGFTSVEIPASSYYQFDVEKGKPEKVFDKWQEIWQMEKLNKTFLCDFECYTNTGEISIHVGTA